MKQRKYARFLTCIIMLSLLVTACKSKEIKTYQLATPSNNTHVMHQAHASAMQHPSNTMYSSMHPQALKWTVPGGWHVAPASGMRTATFHIPSSSGHEPSELSVISLSQQAGNLSANINRWRGQLNLEPIQDNQIDDFSEKFTTEFATFTLVSLESNEILSGSDKKRFLIAILPTNNQIYFFKLTGASSEVLQQKESFLHFLKSVSANQ